MNFNLKSYFSISSLIGIFIVVVVLSLFYRHVSVQSLKNNETRANVNLTTLFANTLWPKYKGFLKYTSTANAEKLENMLVIRSLQKDVKSLMENLNVVKVKIYNLDGTTIFSTSPKQIGQNSSDNPGVLAAKRGEVISEITYKNEIYAFEKLLSERNILSTYIPIYKKDTGDIEAVFELYSDITDFLNDIDSTQWTIIIGVSIALSILYLFLYVIVNHADRIIKKQENDRLTHLDKINRLAYYDTITGLPNKTKFIERLDESITNAQENNEKLALLFIDLDRFKLINDSLGHHAGDTLLKIISERLLGHLRDKDIFFRWGGDEFTIIIEKANSLDTLKAIAARIIDYMSQPITISENEISITTSIGIAIYPTDCSDSNELIKCADVAMYKAKESGRNRCVFYTPKMNEQAHSKLTLENDLKKAIKNQEFVLHYQPKVCFQSGFISGVEALIRWKHPQLGMIQPNEFIPTLEETGLIIDVDEWILRNACKQIQLWKKYGLPPIVMSINISTIQFKSKSFLHLVEKILNETRINPKQLNIELTESIFIDESTSTFHILRRLKKLGIQLSIDDFGSGYSSLGYLKRLPVDYIKIDRSLLKNFDQNAKDAAIISAITFLAQKLDIKIVAEGIETRSQLDSLRSHHCHEVQGFFFSRPLPVKELTHILHNHVTLNSPVGKTNNIAYINKYSTPELQYN